MELKTISNLREQIEQQKTQIKTEVREALNNPKGVDIIVSDDLNRVIITYEDKKNILFGTLDFMRLTELGLCFSLINFEKKRISFEVSADKEPKKFAIGEMIDYINTLDDGTKVSIMNAIASTIKQGLVKED